MSVEREWCFASNSSKTRNQRSLIPKQPLWCSKSSKKKESWWQKQARTEISSDASDLSAWQKKTWIEFYKFSTTPLPKLVDISQTIVNHYWVKLIWTKVIISLPWFLPSFLPRMFLPLILVPLCSLVLGVHLLQQLPIQQPMLSFIRFLFISLVEESTWANNIRLLNFQLLKSFRGSKILKIVT